jgi:transposase
VQTVLAQQPLSGHVFVFRGHCDGDGLYLLAKRLERGRFVSPQTTSSADN